MINTVKEYKLQNGEKLGNYLENEYASFKTEWSQIGNVVTFLVYVPGLRSPNIFKWEVKGDSIYSTNESAITVTPELNKTNLEIAENRNFIRGEDLMIHNYVKENYRENSQPIEVVFDEASKEFGLPQEDIEAIYLKVENTSYKKG
ncbi:hypothetical protein [Mesobacillus foraminis]|uniref:Uncharacterized protein n=1 Tax=Mesobacillus foraminis TaxID=279826 RepID=A0A4R2B7R3_9BACI|nr:hypothetical protein [Mesobacillus foraminis]TCN22741.1 hypothetical protein EV146_110227 [Mesobacillus foraminis]